MSVQIKGVGTIGGLDEGLNITGIVTATSFVGGLPITNGADNRVITASSASAIQGESSLTYDALELHVNNASPKLKLTDTDNSGVVHLKNVGGAGILTTSNFKTRPCSYYTY